MQRLCNRNLQTIWSEELSSSGLLEGNLQEWCTHVTSEKKKCSHAKGKKKKEKEERRKKIQGRVEGKLKRKCYFFVHYNVKLWITPIVYLKTQLQTLEALSFTNKYNKPWHIGFIIKVCWLPMHQINQHRTINLHLTKHWRLNFQTLWFPTTTVSWTFQYPSLFRLQALLDAKVSQFSSLI